MVLSKRIIFLCCTLFVAGYFLLSPNITQAQGTVVIFFSGLCNNPTTCRAAENANASMAPKLQPEGVRFKAPSLTGSAYYTSTAELNSTVQFIGNDRAVLVAYSGGYKALLQTVNAMSEAQLRNVKSIVSLEANYAGFDQAVNRVRAFNPNVEVRRFAGSQCGTNHSNMPGSPCVADAIRNVALNGGVGLKDFSTASYSQSSYNTGNLLPSNRTMTSLFSPTSMQPGGNIPFTSAYSPLSSQDYVHSAFMPSQQTYGAPPPASPSGQTPTQSVLSFLNNPHFPLTAATTQPYTIITTDLSSSNSVRITAGLKNETSQTTDLPADSVKVSQVTQETKSSTFGPTNYSEAMYYPASSAIDFRAAILDIVARMEQIILAFMRLFPS